MDDAIFLQLQQLRQSRQLAEALQSHSGIASSLTNTTPPTATQIAAPAPSSLLLQQLQLQQLRERRLVGELLLQQQIIQEREQQRNNLGFLGLANPSNNIPHIDAALIQALQEHQSRKQQQQQLAALQSLTNPLFLTAASTTVDIPSVPSSAPLPSSSITTVNNNNNENKRLSEAAKNTGSKPPKKRIKKEKEDSKKKKDGIVCPYCGHENHNLEPDDKGELICDACGEAINDVSKTKKKKKKNEEDRLPVTILSGFLGSGKTTLLKYILESKEHGHKIAVIVNDMAEINIDGNAVQHISQVERELVQLSNGCICCTLRGDLIREIARIKTLGQFDYILIESTGIAEPQQVAESFCFSPETQELAQDEVSMLWTQARLDTCVTVVDTHNFSSQINTLERFADKFNDGYDATTKEGRQEGKKSIAELLVEQVEFANVILLNKTDLVRPKDIEYTKKLIQSLNPTAKLIPTQFGKADLKEILDTKKFDLKEARKSVGWLVSLNNEEKKYHSEADEYGVTSFVYRARVPFHAHKLTQWMFGLIHSAPEWMRMPEDQRKTDSDRKHQRMLVHYGNILRAKGWCWFAGKDSYMFGFSQNGRIGGLVPIMEWYTTMPESQWGAKNDTELEEIKAKFEETHGDRRQEIVFIGTDLKVDEIKKALDDCLLTEKELEEYDFYNDEEL